MPTTQTYFDKVFAGKNKVSRYVLKLEAIGDGLHAWARHFNASLDMGHLPRNSHIMLPKYLKLGKQKSWVAQITGLDPRWGFARTFLYGQKDYSSASGTGNRGIYLYYFLEPGYYEINERVSWKNSRRYFAEVIDEDILSELTREELTECLQREALVLTS